MPRMPRRVLICTTYDNISLFLWYWGKRKRGQPAKRLEHRVTEYCTAFGIDPKCWMRAAQDAPEWYRKVETGAEVFMSAWSTKRVNETNARHAKELFATLPFELP